MTKLIHTRSRSQPLKTSVSREKLVAKSRSKGAKLHFGDKPPEDDSEQIITFELETSKSEPRVKYVMFAVEWPTSFSPDHLHWDPPSYWSIQHNGRFIIYAYHLANMRRTGTVLDTGNYYTALAHVRYYDGYNGKGALVHARDYVLAGLDYKQERWNVSNEGTDERFAENVFDIRSGTIQRWWK